MEISYFSSLYDTRPKTTIDLNQLQSIIIKGLNEEHRQNCLKAKTTINKEELTKVKRRLPCVMLSGTCSSRNLQGFQQHSNLIQLDFDHVQEIQSKFHEIKEDKYSLLSFISPSGNGLKVISRIDGTKHIESFEYLANYYKENYQLNVDQSCKDKTRLMFIPYDTTICRNDAAVESLIMERQPKQLPKRFQNNTPKKVGNITIETLVGKIEQNRRDITSERSNWIKIAFALANEFNEAGREYFHRISQYYDKYSPEETDKTFSYCLRSNKGKISLGTVYHIAKENGVMLF